MNNINISGNLGQDAELNSLPNGDPVCNFSIADNQGKGKSPIWWQCQLFGKRAETLHAFLKKGKPVSVSGTLFEREWEGKKIFNCRINEVHLFASAAESDSHEKEPAQPQPAKLKTTASRSDDCPF